LKSNDLSFINDIEYKSSLPTIKEIEEGIKAIDKKK